MTERFKYILGPMRLPFLVLTPACVLLGAAAAAYSGARFTLVDFLAALVGGVCAHISVNALNEYFDFRSGLDLTTQRTPFSGGSGALPARPAAARSALLTGLVTLALVAAAGLYFWRLRGWGVLIPGITGMLVIYTYTTLLLRSPLTSLLAPGVGFGLLMVMGTAYALGGGVTATAFFAALVPTFLVSDLLLLNQFPDVEADRAVGRRHYPILIGRPASSLIYAAFLVGALLSIVIGIGLGALPGWAALGLLSAVLIVPAAVNARRFADDIPHLVPAMGMNVMINILTPVLVALGLFLGR